MKNNLNKKLSFCTLEKNAFTLIELLVVVSIIGLLSTMVIVSSVSLRIKGKNNSITANMNSLRQAGELYYGSNNSYSGFCTNNDCTLGSDDWKKLCSAIKTLNGNGTVTCNISASAWCATTAFVGGVSYCVDSTSVAKSGSTCNVTACN